MKIIADLGSCWGGSIDSAKKAIDLLYNVGIKYVKLQLCEPNNGNIPIDKDVFIELVDMFYGKVHVSASVWNIDGYNLVLKSGAHWIKFAHSAYNKVNIINKAIDNNQFDMIVITKPLMKGKIYKSSKINYLWTYEINGVPVYPVTCEIIHSKMYGVYDGFSSHAYSFDTCYDAVISGASVVEVHANPLAVTGTPDSVFALSLYDIEKFVAKAKVYA